MIHANNSGRKFLETKSLLDDRSQTLGLLSKQGFIHEFYFDDSLFHYSPLDQAFYDAFPFDEAIFQAYTKQTNHVPISYNLPITSCFSELLLHNLQDDILLEDETSRREN